MRVDRINMNYHNWILTGEKKREEKCWNQVKNGTRKRNVVLVLVLFVIILCTLEIHIHRGTIRKLSDRSATSFYESEKEEGSWY